MTPTASAQETEETYLLGGDDVNVKIRFDLLDIKKLIEIDENGLDLWEPVLKEEFPITLDGVVAIYGIWGRNPPTTTRDTYTLDQFLTELVEPDPGLDIVNVRKRRTRYTIEGCMSEMTAVWARDRATRSVAVESPDRAAVRRAVEMLGLAGHENTSYTEGLRTLIGKRPARHAVIDIGTNSVKFYIGDESPDGTRKRWLDRAAVTRLGEGMGDGGHIQPEPMERTTRAVAGMVEEAKDAGALAVVAVGTAAMRNAVNSALVLESLRERAGLDVTIVTGEEETRLAYVGVKAEVDLGDGDLVVFDTGGGSSQFTFGSGDEIVERFSVNVGAVANTERFGLDHAVDESTLAEARASLASDLEALNGRAVPEVLVGMGGAITNLTAVSLGMAEYDPDLVHGAILDVGEIERQIAMYASTDADGRRSIVGLQPNRAEVILTGALIVRTVMEKLGRETLVVSDRGLRHGLIHEELAFFVDPGELDQEPG
jgi:exopolyphosphatase/guanosine-5'-triphosphate,3'-diphosphate pyrophosphatase